MNKDGLLLAGFVLAMSLLLVLASIFPAASQQPPPQAPQEFQVRRCIYDEDTGKTIRCSELCKTNIPHRYEPFILVTIVHCPDTITQTGFELDK